MGNMKWCVALVQPTERHREDNQEMHGLGLAPPRSRGSEASGEVRPGGTYGGDEDVCRGGLDGLPVTPDEEDARGAGSTIRSLVGVNRFIGVYCGGCCTGPEFLRVPREYPALARWR